MMLCVRARLCMLQVLLQVHGSCAFQFCDLKLDASHRPIARLTAFPLHCRWCCRRCCSSADHPARCSEDAAAAGGRWQPDQLPRHQSGKLIRDLNCL